MQFKIMSLGQKHGKDIEGINAYFDVRFLKNPYWDEKLKYKTGLDKEVRDYVLSTKESKQYLEELKSTLKNTFDSWIKSDRNEEFVVGIACTGGQHRSVSIAFELYEYFKNDYKIKLVHRDIDKKEVIGQSKLAKKPQYIPRIVCIGGGTGLSSLLSGLKQFPLDITAVVTVADDGGSTGVLREQFQMPAPGDLRRVLISLSNTPKLEELFNYRFEDNNDLSSHTVGNIIIAALYRLNGDDFLKTIESLSDIVNTTGRVLPVSKDLVKIEALYEDGTKAVGEAVIPNSEKKIKKVSFNGQVSVNKEVVQAILEADVIVFSSGSLFTSIVPNLLFDEVKSAIKRSYASKVYVSNLMTQRGETSGFNVKDHVDVIENTIGDFKLDCVIANNNFDLDQELLERYQKEGSELVKLSELCDIETRYDNFVRVSENGHIRHDTRKIGFHIFNLAFEKVSE